VTPPADIVDELLAAWMAVRPDLDPSALGVVGRVLILAQGLHKSVEAALARHELSLGQFDILATLRRNTVDRGMTPTQLLRSVVLSSGGMTSRLDKLEAAGLIVRGTDATDRRTIVVMLTAKGKRRIDTATTTRFAEARASAPVLPAQDLEKLEELLRTWLLQNQMKLQE